MKKVALKSLIDIRKGKKAPKSFDSNEQEGLVRYIQIDDLRNDDNLKYAFPKGMVTANIDDVVIAWDGANAGTIGYGLNGIIGSTLARLRIKEGKEVHTPFLGRFLQSQFDFLCTGQN